MEAALGIEACGNRFDVVELKVARDFFDDPHWHWLHVFHIGLDQSVLAEQVHDPLDSARIKMYAVHGLGCEDRSAICARDVQARPHIIVSLF